MIEFVLDASVALRWALRDMRAHLAEQVEALIRSGRAQPVVPALWHWEMANGVVRSLRRQGLGETEWSFALLQLENFSAGVSTEPGPSAPVRNAALLARRHRLTVYDATYLELATRRALPLATLDDDLRRAALQAGVDVDFA